MEDLTRTVLNCLSLPIDQLNKINWEYTLDVFNRSHQTQYTLDDLDRILQAQE